MPRKPPVALFLFSNDLSRFLPAVEKERKIIEEALEHLADTNRLKVVARSSVSVQEAFRLFNRYQGRIILFHFAGHAEGQGLQFNKTFTDNELGRTVGLEGLFRREAAEGRLQLVFLNGCYTNAQLKLLRAAEVPSIIATHHAADDLKAVAFARQFYRFFANADLEEPFDETSPTLEEAFKYALASLKAIHPVDSRQVERGIAFNFSEEMSGQPWVLESINPSWRLPFDVAEENKPYNELLAQNLITAIQPYSQDAQKFLAKAGKVAGWESIKRYSDKAKDIIAYSYVGVLGIQLRKLVAIGKEPFSENKQRKYLANCLLTARRALQLLCFALLSKLWDHQKENYHALSEEQHDCILNFFEDEFELDIQGYVDLLKTLFSFFSQRHLSFPLAELQDFAPYLQTESPFLKACWKLQQANALLDRPQAQPSDCFMAERQLVCILAALNFLADYKMVSIKSISYEEMRNSPPHYLHNYAALGIDSKFNINTERVNYVDAPINTDAILLFKGRYQQSINLFPFIIDVNALTFEGGAKVCFYSCQDLADGSLNFRFLEDNSIVNVTYKRTLAKEEDLNKLMMDQEKRKDHKLDAVFLQFQEARKTILYEAEEPPDEGEYRF